MFKPTIRALDADFTDAPLFRKTASLPIENMKVAAGGEVVVARHRGEDGKEFTEQNKVANAGDAIITRSPGDSFPTPMEKFQRLYEIDPANPGQYRSASFGKAVRLTEDTLVEPSYGGDAQDIKEGGVIYQNLADGGAYGNQQNTFEQDFSRLGKDGSLMPLTASLEDQLNWAVEKNEETHIRDIHDKIADTIMRPNRTMATSRQLQSTPA